MSKVDDYVAAAAATKPTDFSIENDTVAFVNPDGSLTFNASSIPSEYAMKLVDWLVENYK